MGRMEKQVAAGKALLRAALAGIRKRLYYLAGDPRPWRNVPDGAIRFNDDLEEFQVYNEFFGFWFVIRKHTMSLDQRMQALLANPEK